MSQGIKRALNPKWLSRWETQVEWACDVSVPLKRTFGKWPMKCQEKEALSTWVPMPPTRHFHPVARREQRTLDWHSGPTCIRRSSRVSSSQLCALNSGRRITTGLRMRRQTLVALGGPFDGHPGTEQKCLASQGTNPWLWPHCPALDIKSANVLPYSVGVGGGVQLIYLHFPWKGWNLPLQSLWKGRYWK